ncbi:hypothetical protein ACA910_013330 [Epithemia clementina (nom. ined.)]
MSPLSQGDAEAAIHVKRRSNDTSDNGGLPEVADAKANMPFLLSDGVVAENEEVELQEGSPLAILPPLPQKNNGNQNQYITRHNMGFECSSNPVLGQLKRHVTNSFIATEPSLPSEMVSKPSSSFTTTITKSSPWTISHSDRLGLPKQHSKRQISKNEVFYTPSSAHLQIGPPQPSQGRRSSRNTRKHSRCSSFMKEETIVPVRSKTRLRTKSLFNLRLHQTRSMSDNRLYCNVEDGDNTSSSADSTSEAKQHSIFSSSLPAETIVKFLFCFWGLQVFYVSGGYLQEFILTNHFEPTPLNPHGRFPSSLFCVFLNRCFALAVALIAVRIRHGAFFQNNKAPISVFVPCAISNTASSYCQNAALKYVSYPLMTMFKSSSIIPVMIMGYLIKGSTYPSSRYVEAGLITAGVVIFYLSTGSSENAGDSSSSSYEYIGMGLLMAYVTMDSFTTQWQHQIYSMYGRENIDPYQMMLGVDATAIIFTTASLLCSGELPMIWEFFQTNPHVLPHALLYPIMSTCGQLCIFYTIKEFGPLVFTVIMTTRKFFSIGLSSALFGHEIGPHAVFGGLLVLIAILNSVVRGCIDKHQVSSDKKVDDRVFAPVTSTIILSTSGTPNNLQIVPGHDDCSKDNCPNDSMCALPRIDTERTKNDDCTSTVTGNNLPSLDV